MASIVDGWVAPPLWTVPRLWPASRVFVICSGESIRRQIADIHKIRGPVIAVKHGLLAYPSADVLFLSGEKTPEIAAGLVPKFTGEYMIVRGRSDPRLDPRIHRIGRSKAHGTLSDDAHYVTGLDAGTSAINLAYLFGAREIILLGYDMRGGHFVDKHPLPFPPLEHFRRHQICLPALNEDARRRGVRIVNCSEGSAVTAFEVRSLKEFV